jgi:hypothetical protein
LYTCHFRRWCHSGQHENLLAILKLIGIYVPLAAAVANSQKLITFSLGSALEGNEMNFHDDGDDDDDEQLGVLAVIETRLTW